MHLFSFVLLLSFSYFASAGMDEASRNTLISKLERVQVGLASNDPSKIPVTLRLADLYAERARLASNKELDQKAGVKDRQSALKLYREVFDEVSTAQKDRVLIQMGHLYQMQGDENEAQKFYQRVSGGDPVLRAEAQLSIAEILFRARAYQKAEGHYKTVLQTEGASSKGLAAYRLAWSSFNMGDVERGKAQLITMLKTPALLNRQGSSEVADKQFAEEVSIDLATFIARTNFVESDLQLLFQLSPEAAKISNLNSVAAESGRIGKKQQSLMAWNFVHGKLTDPSQRFNAWAHISTLNLDLAQKDKALEFFTKAVNLRSQIKDCNEMCKETDSRLRGILISWNKIEKTAPSSHLAEAYRVYQAQYPTDGEVHFWSTSVHRDLKMWPEAWAASSAARDAYAADPKKQESVLLYRLELAELAKNPQWLGVAQDEYIAQSKERSKLSEVRYQRAKAAYDGARYQEAAEQMRVLALDSKVSTVLRKQAADLALDSLVLLKSPQAESQMLEWSRDFAGVFTGENKKDFEKIRQKAVLTQSANLSKENPERAYAVMADFQVGSASAEDKTLYLKNKMLLAEQLKKFPEARATAEELLLQPGLAPADVEFGLGKKAHYAELTLDFSSSLRALEKMKMDKVAPDQRLLKLALYSQLAGLNPESYFREYLKTAKPSEMSAQVALELVKQAKDPYKETLAQYRILSSQPEILGDAYLFAYNKGLNPLVLQKGSEDKVLKGTPAGKLFARAIAIKGYSGIKTKLESHQLLTKSQSSLTSSIKARAALLEDLEKLANLAIQGGDWTTQLLNLNLVATQADRFYQELLSLPMPDGLSEEEQGQYMNILSQQAAPYQSKAQQAKVKVAEFWSQTVWREGYVSAWSKEDYRPLVKVEIAALSEVAPADAKVSLASIGEITGKTSGVVLAGPQATMQSLEASRSKVRSEPFNVTALKELLELEKQAKNRPMVQYLEQRIGGKNE